MATVPPTTEDPHLAHPRGLRTSELLRRAASELAASDELAQELRVRAIWIERARRDKAVSDARRRGVAAIEDAGDDPGPSRSSVVLRCKGRERCSFHGDGGPVDEPCAAHGAIVLLARAVSEALAADNVDDVNAGG
jgi:hypothetical protein